MHEAFDQNRVRFEQGDAMNLRAGLGTFEEVLGIEKRVECKIKEPHPFVVPGTHPNPLVRENIMTHKPRPAFLSSCLPVLNSRVAAIALCMTISPVASRAQSIDWQTAAGGDGSESLFSGAQAADGGYAFAGSSDSGPSGNKTSENYGSSDFWLVKLDGDGNMEWDKAYGGTNADDAWDVRRTSDGGYILGGVSFSGATGNKTNSDFGSGDYWLVKTDSSGNKEWEQVFGGTDLDILNAVLAVSDGGYLLLGQSYSGATGNKTSSNLGSGDYWLIKTDSEGSKEWERVFGGAGDDSPKALEATNDGGFILGGSSDSGITGNKANGTFGINDFWIVKVDGNGIKQWERVYGGDGRDELNAIKPTSDGGYIVAGTSDSDISGNKTVPNFGSSDWWVLKLDGNGEKQWEAVLGGTDHQDYLNRVLQTPDGGYVLAGSSWSSASGNKTNENIGASDYWVVKLDGSGNKLWEQAFGGTESDFPWALVLAGDGGYVVAGHSVSGASGNKTSSSFGFYDTWMVKVPSTDTAIPRLSITRTPTTSVVIAWPASANGFTIQQNMRVSTTNWTPPSEAVNDDGTNKFIIVTTPTGQEYFRLIKSP